MAGWSLSDTCRLESRAVGSADSCIADDPAVQDFPQDLQLRGDQITAPGLRQGTSQKLELGRMPLHIVKPQKPVMGGRSGLRRFVHSLGWLSELLHVAHPAVHCWDWLAALRGAELCPCWIGWWGLLAAELSCTT